MSAAGGNKAIVAALSANLGIAATKFVAFLLTMSSSMLAESIHSAADSGNQLLLIVGGKRSRKRATREHPFGFGRERYLYAFLVSIVLFAVGGLFALYEGYHKVTHPEAITSWAWVPVAVLVVAIGLEGYSFRTAVHEANPLRGESTWWTFLRRAKAPELPVVLLEDSAALLGLVFALAGVGLTIITGNGVWDGVGTLGIGVLLVAVALFLAVETQSLLVGESASAADLSAIERAVCDSPGAALIHMRTMHLGPDELLVAAKIAVPPGCSADEIATTINDTEARIRAAVPIARIIYLEPDLRRATDEVAAG